jgi:small subunit ribosomal protein S4e
MPKTWPLKRKGTKYVAIPSSGLGKSIPLVVVLRDILDLAKTRREAKRLISQKKVKVNSKIVRDENFPLSLFDVLSLDNKSFKLVLNNKKFNLEKIDEKEADEKIVKVIGKKLVKKGRIQINLSDGRNYLTKEKIKTGDSAVVNFKENKISEILPFKDNSKVVFIGGKHLGETGTIDKIDKMIIVKIGKEKINSKSENLMVIK